METIDQQEENNRGQDNGTRGIIRSAEQPASPRFWCLDSQHAAIEVDLSIYSPDTLIRAAYKFTDRAFFFLSSDQTELRRCTVFVGVKTPGRDVDGILADFVNELLDQSLRERLETEFGSIRTLLVAQAFSEGNLLDPDRENRDYRDDSGAASEVR